MTNPTKHQKIPHADWCNSLVIGTQERPVGRCDCGASDQHLRTPQGEPALNRANGSCLPGTREPVVTAPQGNAGESPARLLSSKKESPELFEARQALLREGIRSGNLERDFRRLQKDHEQYVEWASPQLQRLGREMLANDRLRQYLGYIGRMKCDPDKVVTMTTLSAAIQLAEQALSGDSSVPETSTVPLTELQECLASEGAKDYRIEALEAALDWALLAVFEHYNEGEAPNVSGAFEEIEKARARIIAKCEELGAKAPSVVETTPDDWGVRSCSTGMVEYEFGTFSAPETADSLSVRGRADTDPVAGREKPQGEPAPPEDTLPGSFVGIEQPSSGKAPINEVTK